MNGGRPTTDPKGESIRVRVNADTKIRLQKISEETGDNVSELIRKAIGKYMRQF